MDTLWENRTGRISFQVLNEYYVIVTQKLKPGMTQVHARLDVRNLMAWDPVPVDESVMEISWTIQEQYRFSWWDSLIVAGAVKAHCSILLTEDLQHGQQIHDLTILNPFHSETLQLIS